MVKAIVGANWGDEGKGKITDMLAEQSDVVIRFQGGANAGHTIINDYGRFALHILPSGTFYPHVTNIIGNGVALDIQKLVDELGSITSQGVPAPNLIVSERAQILMPYHRLQDSYEGGAPGRQGLWLHQERHRPLLLGQIRQDRHPGLRPVPRGTGCGSA